MFGVRLAEVCLWNLLGDDFWNGFRISRFDSGYMFGVSLRLLLEKFHIFYVKGDPEVDSRPGAVRTKNLDIISTSCSYDVVDGFFAAYCGIFRTPSAWT